MDSSRTDFLKENNFNLIRILAAIQVFLTHSIDHLKITEEWLLFIYYKFLIYFPGVPVFFTISGFLIYASFEKNHKNLLNFYRNRILRIYPGLIVCLIFTVACLFIDFPFDKIRLFTFHFFAWLFAQLSVFQFYTPNVLRFWGVGTPNGSLWTISIEMQFYFIIPLVFYFLNYFKKWEYVFLGLFLLSILVNITFNQRLSIIEKLYHEFIFKYLYYFMFGIFAYKMWDKISLLFINRFSLITGVYVIYSLIVGNLLGIHIESYIITSPLVFLGHALLSLWTLSFAFSNTTLSYRLIKDHDLSYGVYIYHMPIVNILNHRNYEGNIYHLLLTFIITLTMAGISWHLIEKNALRLKLRNLTVIK